MLSSLWHFIYLANERFSWIHLRWATKKWPNQTLLTNISKMCHFVVFNFCQTNYELGMEFFSCWMEFDSLIETYIEFIEHSSYFIWNLMHGEPNWMKRSRTLTHEPVASKFEFYRETKHREMSQPFYICRLMFSTDYYSDCLPNTCWTH